MITRLDFKFRKKTCFLFVLMLCFFIILEVDIRKNQSIIDLNLGPKYVTFFDVKKTFPSLVVNLLSLIYLFVYKTNLISTSCIFAFDVA